MKNNILFIFLDGYGMGENSSDNPFTLASMPFFNTILEGPLVKSKSVNRPGVLLKGIDACLDVEGIPQSATGQTALFTGQNAAKELGFHLPAYPEIELTGLINKGNILKDTVKAGLKATFANSYSRRYFQLIKQRKLFHSATTLCVYSAGLTFRSLEDLKEGRAVHWDITRHSLADYPEHSVIPVSPERAGRDLARLAEDFDLVLFECFLPDLLGHKKAVEPKLEVLSRIDTFCKEVYEEKSESVSIVISSDHGNIETIKSGSHTRNQVPLIVLGKAADHFKNARSIMDLKALMESWLGIEEKA